MDSLAKLASLRSKTTTNGGLDLERENDSSTLKGNVVKAFQTRHTESVGQSMQILQVNGWTQDMVELASSLVASIREQRRRTVDEDHFITLSHHPSRGAPVTKTQLMISIARKYLEHHPRSFSQIESLLMPTEEALQTGNEAWKEASVWRLLRTLLGARESRQTFLILVQPIDEMFAQPFVELASSLVSLVKETELPCKTLVIQTTSSTGPLPNEDDMVTIVDVGYDHSAASAALQLDQDAERLPDGFHSSAPWGDSSKLLDRPCVPGLTPRQSLIVAEKHPLSFLSLTEVQFGPKAAIDIILNSVPESFRPWVTSGLLWVTHAIRPLTHAEFAAAITNSSESINYSNSPSLLIEGFRRLLCEIIETDGNTVYLATRPAALLVARVVGEERKPGPGNDADKVRDSANQITRDGYQSTAHPHLHIARCCIELLQKHFENAGAKRTKPSGGGPGIHGESPALDAEHSELQEEKNTGVSKGYVGAKGDQDVEPAIDDTAEATRNEDVGEARDTKETEPTSLFSYAVEHWLSHIQLCGATGECSADAPGELGSFDFVIKFVRDQRLVNQWLDARNSLRGLEVRRTSQYDIPSIAETLGLGLERSGDLRRLLNLVQLASGIQTGDDEDVTSSLVVAASQLDDTEVLAKLDSTTSDSETLMMAFKSGADAALCYLASKHPTFVGQNRASIALHAVRLGNLKLLGELSDMFTNAERDESTQLQEFDWLIFHEIAQLGIPTPSEPCWHAFKAHVRATSADGGTALHVAAISGHVTLVQRLLEAGLDKDVKDSSGATPLLLAAKNGRFAVVVQLLAAGADTSLADGSRQTPLHAASSGGFLDIVKLLLRSSVPNKARTRHDRCNTPLHLALSKNYPEVAKALLQHATEYLELVGVVRTRYQHSTGRGKHKQVLDSASTTTGKDPVEAAWAEFPDLDGVSAEAGGAHAASATRVHCASATFVVDSSSVTIFSTETRVSQSFGLDSRNSAGLTPLILAIKGGDAAVVRGLLRLRANTRIPDRRKRRPLHYAAALYKSDIISELLEVPGVDVDPRDSNGNTPLHDASSRGNVNAIRKLVAAGADSNARNEEGRCPLELASKHGSVRAAEAMAPFCSRRNLTEAFLEAASRGNVDDADVLLDAGAEKDAGLRDGSTALQCGALQSNTGLVRTLLVRKADPNRKTYRGRAPLHEAALHDAAGCLKLLLDAGADVNVTDEDGTTALYEAAEAGHARCVALLLAAGAAFVVPSSSIQRGADSFLDLALRRFKPDIFDQVFESVVHREGRRHPSDDALLAFFRDYDDEGGADALAKLRILLERGLEHEREVGKCGTLLHYAALWDKPELVALLAAGGRARPGVVHKEQGTPLRIAAGRGNLKIVQTLLKAGADACRGNGKADAPLHAAVGMPSYVRRGVFLDIARAILEHSPAALHKVFTDSRYPTVLQAAVAKGTAEMVRLILDNKPRFDVLAGNYGTPLHLAVERNYETETQLLLEMGAPHLALMTRDVEGRLPVHLTALSEYGSPWRYDTFSDETEVGPSTTDYQDRTLMHFCAASSNFAMLSTLITYEDPEALRDRDLDGWTPLHWACRGASFAAAEQILESDGGDNLKDAKTTRGWRPIDVAIFHGGRIFDDHPNARSRLQPDKDDDAPDPAEGGTTPFLPCEVEDTRPSKPMSRSTSKDEPGGYNCGSCKCVSFFGSFLPLLRWGRALLTCRITTRLSLVRAMSAPSATASTHVSSVSGTSISATTRITPL